MDSVDDGQVVASIHPVFARSHSSAAKMNRFSLDKDRGLTHAVVSDLTYLAIGESRYIGSPKCRELTHHHLNNKRDVGS